MGSCSHELSSPMLQILIFGGIIHYMQPTMRETVFMP
jgi:hypothetical protein